MNDEPTFKAIFGKDWDVLPPIIKKHYAIRPYTDDTSSVEGTLDLVCAAHIKALSWIFWLLGGVPPVTENDVPVTVDFTSDKNSRAFRFHRVFHLKNRKPYHFISSMVQIKDNEVMEVMKFGICWHMLYLWENEKVILRHKGYALRVFGKFIPLPVTFLFGRVDAEEVPVSDDTFTMRAAINHPLFGEAYEYKGLFRIKHEV